MASKIVVNLDTSKEYFKQEKCKQNDDLLLEANIFENGAAKDLTNCSIVIQATKADNTYVIQNTDIAKVNNTLTTELKRDFTRVPGETLIEIVLIEGGKQNTTFSFILEVDASVIRGAEESKDLITSLEVMQDAVVEMGKISEETKELIQNSGAASKEEMNKVNTQLAEITYNIDSFPRLAIETTDKGRIERAISQIPEGGALLFPIRNYDLTGNILLNKRINILGKIFPIYVGSNLINGTLFKNGKIIIRTNDIEINNIGIEGGIDNGFEGNSGDCYNVKIKNCATNVTSHGFLFESYNGKVENVIVENCYSYNSTHGFISKAKEVKFINCVANNHSQNGFGFISDNIPGSTNKGINENNSVKGCKAIGCGVGYITYCRDYFSENNSNNIEMKNLNMSECYAINCTNSYKFGDTGNAPSGQTYINCKNVLLNDCYDINSSQNSCVISRLEDSDLNNFIIEKPITWGSSFGKNIKIKTIGNIENPNSRENFKLIGIGATPNFDSNYKIFKTQNTTQTVVTNFLGGEPNREVTLLIEEDNTILTANENLILQKQYRGKGSFVKLKYIDGKWYDIGGFSVGTFQVQKDLSTSVVGIGGNISIYDIVVSSNTANKISFSLNISDIYPSFSILIRPTSSSVTSFGGFETTNAVIPTDFPTNLEFGKIITSNWTYVKSLSKYICLSWNISKFN